MKRMLKVMTVLLVASVMFAQSAPPEQHNPAEHAQHHLKMMTTLLSLTAAQQQQASAIFTNAANSQTGIHQNMKAAHEALDQAIKNNDQAGIEQAAATIGQLTTQMVVNHGKAQAAFYQILTPDQKSKLNEFESEEHGPMGHMGGHMGPGMH